MKIVCVSLEEVERQNPMEVYSHRDGQPQVNESKGRRERRRFKCLSTKPNWCKVIYVYIIY